MNLQHPGRNTKKVQKQNKTKVRKATPVNYVGVVNQSGLWPISAQVELGRCVLHPCSGHRWCNADAGAEWGLKAPTCSLCNQTNTGILRFSCLHVNVLSNELEQSANRQGGYSCCFWLLGLLDYFWHHFCHPFSDVYTLTRSQVRHWTELTMVPSNTSETTLRYFFWCLFFGGENVVTAVNKREI